MFKKLLFVIAFVLFGVFSSGKALAISITAQISGLPEYETTSTFKLSYTALQIHGQAIVAQFYYQKEGEPWRYLGNEIAGGAGSVSTDNSIVNSEGKYFFKVTASSNGESAESQTETLVDWTSPSVPTEYSKSKTTNSSYHLSWRNPDDADFYRVFVYRSTDQNFTLDDGSKLVEVGGARNAVMTWDDTGLDPTMDYYYDLIAFDNAGNASRIVGDGGTVETVEVSPTGTVQGASTGTGGAGKVTQLPKEEGQILGEEVATPTPTPTVQPESAIVSQVSKAVSSNRNLLVIGAVVLIAIYYFRSRRSSSK